MGIMTMQIDVGLEIGTILLKTNLNGHETSPELAARLAEAGAPLVTETLRRLESRAIRAVAQNNPEATFRRRWKKEDGRIDWSLPARKIYCRMRGFQPWPERSRNFAGRRARCGQNRQRNFV